MTGSGFRVDPANIRAAAAGFSRSGDHVSAAKDALGAGPVPARAFGRYGSGPALAGKVSGAVEGHLAAATARIERLRSLAGKLDVAANSYDRTEDRQRDILGDTADRMEETDR